MSRVSLFHRYGRVLLASLVVLSAMVAMPFTTAGSAAVLLLKGLLLAIAVASSGTARARGLTVVAVMVASTVAVAGLTGELPTWLVAALGGAFMAAAIATLWGGTADMLRADGVTAQVVFAGLAVYLLVGLLFADLIGFVAGVDASAFFAQGTDGSAAERVYYSFVTLTTTGFGDFSPATGSGRALAVLEVLLGQIYLVTVVALLVGNLPRRGVVKPPAD